MNLQDKFQADELDWRVMRSGLDKNNKIWALVIPYVDNRAIQNRLDQVCSSKNWKNEEFKILEKGVMCGLSIKIDNEWITKYDGADYRPDNQQDQKIIFKAALSDAQKRAAVQWGIGRYLYQMSEMFAEITENGRHRGSFKGQNGKRVFFKWNPPIIPKQFLPEEK